MIVYVIVQLLPLYIVAWYKYLFFIHARECLLCMRADAMQMQGHTWLTIKLLLTLSHGVAHT
jgi:hypothetical protein